VAGSHCEEMGVSMVILVGSGGGGEVGRSGGRCTSCWRRLGRSMGEARTVTARRARRVAGRGNIVAGSEVVACCEDKLLSVSKWSARCFVPSERGIGSRLRGDCRVRVTSFRDNELKQGLCPSI